MSEQTITYRAENLNIYQLNSNYTLLLQIYPDSFSYAVTDQNHLVALATNVNPNELNEPSAAHDLLTYDYRNVVAALATTGFTLIPAALYSEEHVSEVARFLDVKEGEKVFAQALDNDNYVIYKVEEKVLTTAKIFDLQKTVFGPKGWVAAMEKNFPSKYDLYLNIDKTQVSMLYFAESKLRFYNTFAFNNPDELVYFTSLVAQQLELQATNVNLVLSGDVELNDRNAARLAEFFNGVELNAVQTLSLPAEIHPHQVMTLTALSLCVSSEVF